MPNAIEVEELTKSYGDRVAVDRISFTVEEGEFFGLLGPNGAGKTTTLEMIEGLTRPDDGAVRVLGQQPWPRNSALLPRIGVQLQASAFFDRLTAREQISTFAALNDAPEERIDEMLALVELTDRAQIRAEKLSGGEAQRLSIACALVHDPEVLFLDEPTAALDPRARRNLWDLMRDINGAGTTIVLTTHGMDEAELLCDEVAIIDSGRIIEHGPPARLVRDLDAPVRISVDPAALDLAVAREMPYVASVDVGGDAVTLVTRDPAAVLTGLAQHGALEGLQINGANLEDVFLEKTGREYVA